jgi:sugar phosphate isomerase/epimerase
MTPTLQIGVNIDGVLHRDDMPPVDAESRFRMIADAGVFDYVEMNPPEGIALAPYLGLSERYALPVRVIGGIFCAGCDEAHLRHIIEWAPRFGSKVLNCQLYASHADGHRLTDAEVAQFYVQACEWADTAGCIPSLEVHVDMWSEDFGRVARVGELLARDGIALRLTLDHSHLIFKIGNAYELDVSHVAACDLQTVDRARLGTSRPRTQRHPEQSSEFPHASSRWQGWPRHSIPVLAARSRSMGW